MVVPPAENIAPRFGFDEVPFTLQSGSGGGAFVELNPFDAPFLIGGRARFGRFASPSPMLAEAAFSAWSVYGGISLLAQPWIIEILLEAGYSRFTLSDVRDTVFLLLDTSGHARGYEMSFGGVAMRHVFYGGVYCDFFAEAGVGFFLARGAALPLFSINLGVQLPARYPYPKW